MCVADSIHGQPTEYVLLGVTHGVGGSRGPQNARCQESIGSSGDIPDAFLDFSGRVRKVRRPADVFAQTQSFPDVRENPIRPGRPGRVRADLREADFSVLAGRRGKSNSSGTSRTRPRRPG